MPAAATDILTRQHLQQLDELGFTVVKGFLETSLTARLRQHIDSLCPPIKGNARHDLRHPIAGDILSEALYRTPLIPLAAELLGSRDLRLLEQVLCRSDPAGEQATPGPTGWHVDVAFPPEEFRALPKRTYYHHIHALSTVEPGGGAFTIIPGSHHAAYQACARCGPDCLKDDPIKESGVDETKAVEVCPQDGDLLIFNPMSIHSASRNIRSTPRYAYFASFFDGGAEYLRQQLKKMNYARPFPEALHRDLPPEWPRLLSWDA